MASILLVDDNASLLQVASIILRRAGHNVATSPDGKKALQLIREGHIFDLMITDIVMPEQDGIETILEARKIGSTFKIIAMSGGGLGSATDYLMIAGSLGANLTLPKPFNEQELLKAVNAVLDSPSQED